MAHTTREAGSPGPAVSGAERACGERRGFSASRRLFARRAGWPACQDVENALPIRESTRTSRPRCRVAGSIADFRSRNVDYNFKSAIRKPRFEISMLLGEPAPSPADL